MSRKLPPCDHDECPPSHCKRPGSLDASAGSPSNLDGYRAAVIIIKRLLDNAENDTPKTQRYVKTRSASFRAGYYRGLLTAHCMSALGEFPAANVDPIRTALEMENTELSQRSK